MRPHQLTLAFLLLGVSYVSAVVRIGQDYTYGEVRRGVLQHMTCHYCQMEECPGGDHERAPQIVSCGRIENPGCVWTYMNRNSREMIRMGCEADVDGHGCHVILNGQVRCFCDEYPNCIPPQNNFHLVPEFASPQSASADNGGASTKGNPDRIVISRILCLFAGLLFIVALTALSVS